MSPVRRRSTGRDGDRLAAVAAARVTGAGSAPRVLMVDMADRGGIARYTSCLVDALRDEGLEVHTAAPPPVGDPDVAMPATRWGPEIYEMSRFGIYRLRLREIGPSARALVRAVRRLRPDIVHFQSEVLPRLDPVLLRWVRRRAVVVVTAHDPVPLEGGDRALLRQARRWRVADTVVIHAEEPRRLVESSARGVPVRVVPVDLPLGGPPVPRAEARRRLGLGDEPVALLLGLIRPYKGIGLLTHVWPEVAAAVPGARLLLVGEAYPGADLARLLQAPGVELRDEFLPDEEFNLWAAAADVLVLPYHHGAHSGILHRGLAVGTPVLASPSLAEEVERTGAGRVVPLESDAWAEALTAALSGEPPAPPVAPRGHATATETLAVYEEALERAVGHRRWRPILPGPVRVAYYVEGAEFGGVERHLLTLLGSLDRARFDPVVTGVMVPEMADAVAQLGVEVRPLPFVRSKVHLLTWAKVSRGVRRLRPAVFHAMLSQSYAGQYALLAAQAARVPAVVVTAHLPTPPSNRLQADLRRLLMRGVDVQVVPAEWTRAELARLGQLAERVDVIPNGIAVPAFAPRVEARRTLGLPPDGPVIGASMRLVEFKRPDLLVELARLVPEATVVIFGDGPLRAELEDSAAGLDVRFPGFRPDSAELLRALDVFVHPSPTDNQPLAVLEALAAGVPVVAADAGGVAEMVADDKTGLLVPATGRALAAAVTRLLDHPELAARLAAAAVEDVGRRHSARAMASGHEALYDRLLGRAG